MADLPGKTNSAFYPDELVARVRANVGRDAWAGSVRDSAVADAQPWLAFTDDELWEMMFGHTITRSWMVLSNGHCPACQGQTPMYTWKVDALAHRWKVCCPHCGEFFPKNDFLAFHQSGLDEAGVFDPARADRSLLFNAEHPDPSDPLHGFGVDDGEGYVDGDRRWRFIGAYLVYGQWKQLVLGGIKNLSAAYVLTGDPAYAHKAGVLLDRVADLYGTFDFEKEGLAYERSHSTGYVSTWHDACVETRELAEAYDRVFPGLIDDDGLVAFLSEKAVRHGLENQKHSTADIRRNIESGILQEALENSHKIHSNYPQQEFTLLVTETVLGWPDNRERVNEMLDEILATGTAVDGVTGEKGLAAYGTIGPRSVAQILGMYDRLEPGFLEELYRRHPRLLDLFRFHVDTWCLGKYYPHVGDSGGFTRPYEQYAGATFTDAPGLSPSAYSTMLRLYELTGDPAFAQVLHRANGDSTEGLPYDLTADDPGGFRRKVQDAIDAHGETPQVQSVNKEAWHIGILRSGECAASRALWLHYDAGGRHSHRDGMNLGLFAKGMDLLPELGYPPVQFGGWSSPRANWYKMTAGHNTVVVDGRDQQDAAGRTTLWADGERFRAIRVSAPELYGIDQYERTAMLVDVSDEDAYVVDIFRVRGGTDHAKFLHSGFGEIAVDGVDLAPAADYGHGTEMRNFRGAKSVAPGWSVDWRLEDRHESGPGEEVHLRYVDLTEGADAYAAEAWVSLGYDAKNAEAWVPRLMVRRSGEDPLVSTFMCVLEPYIGMPAIDGIRRLPLETADGEPCSDSDVAVEVSLADGRKDLIVALDVDRVAGPVTQSDWGLRLEGELCWARLDADSTVAGAALGNGRVVSIGETQLEVTDGSSFREL